jgi:hypothetical protein
MALTIASRSGMMDKMGLNRAADLKILLWFFYHERLKISRRSDRGFYSEPRIKAVGNERTWHGIIGRKVRNHWHPF